MQHKLNTFLSALLLMTLSASVKAENSDINTSIANQCNADISRIIRENADQGYAITRAGWHDLEFFIGKPLSISGNECRIDYQDPTQEGYFTWLPGDFENSMKITIIREEFDPIKI